MNYKSNVAHIVYASDDKFAEILGVSLVSLYENSMTDITFIPSQNISKTLSMNVEVDRGSLSQYARLFVSSDLPQELNRVLYLDCDSIVNQSIRELWNLNLHGKIIGTLMDAFSKYYRQNIGLEANDIMFNAGVMLINLEKWRKQRVEERLMK